jgi:hypothetical protein
MNNKRLRASTGSAETGLRRAFMEGSNRSSRQEVKEGDDTWVTRRLLAVNRRLAVEPAILFNTVLTFFLSSAHMSHSGGDAK